MPVIKIVALTGFGIPKLAAACRSVPNLSLSVVDTLSDLASEVVDAQGLIVYNGGYSAEVAELLRKEAGALRWIQFATSGTDNAVRHGLPENVIHTNAGDAWAPAVAEHAMALLLGLGRKLPQLERARLARDWSREQLAEGLFFLNGRTLVIVGLGAIGREISSRAQAFGARVIGVSRKSQALSSIDQHLPFDRLADILPAADALILSVALTPETRHMINERSLALMKPSAVLINVSRGAVIDEAALAAALRVKQLGGAALDVFESEPLPLESPLWELDSVILSPHVAGFGHPGAIERVVALCQDNICRFMEGRPLRNVVTVSP